MIDRERIWVWLRQSERAYPYAEELLSNEVYVLVSAIAMNAMLAFFPFVILLISISTRFFPEWQVHTMTYQILEQYLPSNQNFIIRTIRGLALGFGRVQIISLLVLVWSVANVFIPLEMALNRAWGIKESRTFWRSQGLAVVMSLLCGVLAFAFVAGASFTQGGVAGVLPQSWAMTQSVVRFINIKLWMVPLTLILFFLTFYVVPNRKVTWREILPAAVFTGLLWEISNYVFMWILPYLGLSDIYGGFVVTVTLLTWAYVSGIILLFGANLTARSALPSLTAPLFDQPRSGDIV